MSKPIYANNGQGSALLIMLWAVALLSATILGLAAYFDVVLEEDSGAINGFRARQLAESGLAIAINPVVEKSDTVLIQSLSPTESFKVAIKSEQGRLNINALALANDREILMDLFEFWEISVSDADTLIDAIYDWVDKDEVTRLSGAEYEEYAAVGKPDYPANQPFQSVDEMGEVLGMELLEEMKPDWRDFFTVWGTGKLDPNAASTDLLQAVLGIDELQAEAIITHRDGPDGIPDTEDDTPFRNQQEFQAYVGLSEIGQEKAGSRMTFNSRISRIESTGTAGNTSRTIILVVDRRQRGGAVYGRIEE